jgi:hypothetical protein
MKKGATLLRVLALTARIVGIIAVIIALNLILNPLFWPIDRIEKWMYNKTPIGTSMDEAAKTYKRSFWHVGPKLDSGYGILVEYEGGRLVSHSATPAVCSKSIRVGIWFFPPIGWLNAHLGFDDEERLVDISANKGYIGL